MTRVHIVDRVDQVRWHLSPSESSSYVIQIHDNHHEIKTWLDNMTQDTVVICGQGVMPRVGAMDHPYHDLFQAIQRNQFRVYFSSDRDAMAFKLVWGGSSEV